MENNIQSRRWQLVINNPQNYGLNHDAIVKILMLFSVVYFCLSDEIGKNGTYHTHIFVIFKSPVRFGTIKERFLNAHIEKALGSATENRDYITKTGKWENSEKSETRVNGSYLEYGTIPLENGCSRMQQLIESIKNGASNSDIISAAPNFAFKVKDIDALRQSLLSDEYLNKTRNVDVTYIFGATGMGKTRGIFQENAFKDVCRITSYKGIHGVQFDAYSSQKVLVFEEFSSQVQVEDILNYLDIYPVMLPARYYDRIACFDKVYFTSNVSLFEQYPEVQSHRPETWRAFLRRIHKVIEYKADGSVVEKTIKES